MLYEWLVNEHLHTAVQGRQDKHHLRLASKISLVFRVVMIAELGVIVLPEFLLFSNTGSHVLMTETVALYHAIDCLL